MRGTRAESFSADPSIRCGAHREVVKYWRNFSVCCEANITTCKTSDGETRSAVGHVVCGGSDWKDLIRKGFKSEHKPLQ